MEQLFRPHPMLKRMLQSLTRKQSPPLSLLNAVAAVITPYYLLFVLVLYKFARLLLLIVWPGVSYIWIVCVVWESQSSVAVQGESNSQMVFHPIISYESPSISERCRTVTTVCKTRQMEIRIERHHR